MGAAAEAKRIGAKVPRSEERRVGKECARKKAKLTRPCYRSESVKILFTVRGSGQQDFEGLLWGQRT